MKLSIVNFPSMLQAHESTEMFGTKTKTVFIQK
jgi:hypothetical protein